MGDDREIIEVKEKLGFDDIFAEGRVKQIAWGETFQEWPIERQLNYAKKLASAMNEAADHMQKYLELANKMFQEAQNAEKARDIAKQTLTQNIIEGNQREQDLQMQIVQLQGSLREKERVIDDLNIQLLKYEGV